MFRRGVHLLYVYVVIFKQWESRINPAYDEFERYEGALQNLTPFDIIRGSMHLKKQHIRYKYQTCEETGLLVECNSIISGKKYNMDDIKLRIDISREAKCLKYNYYFHCK